MEITEATFRLLPFLQKYINPPVLFNPVTMEMIENTFFEKKSRERILWQISTLDLLFLAVSSVVRIKTLFNRWNEGNNTEQLCVCTALLTFCSFNLMVYRNLAKARKEIAFAFTQALKLIKHKFTGVRRQQKIRNWKGAMIYATAITMVSGAMVVFCAYSVLSYNPIKLLVGLLALDMSITSHVIFDVMLGVLSGVLYTFTAYHGITCNVFLILVISSFVEVNKVFSYNLFRRRMLHNTFRVRGDYYAGRAKPLRESLMFRKSMRCYRCLQILISIGNQALGNFLQMGLILGLVLGSLGGYVAIKLYHEFPFLIYTAISLTLPLYVIVIIVLSTLGSIPSENAAGFRRLWRWKLRKRVDRMWLSSCAPIGFSFGFIEECRRITGFSIINVLVDMIVTMVLLPVN